MAAGTSSSLSSSSSSTMRFRAGRMICEVRKDGGSKKGEAKSGKSSISYDVSAIKSRGVLTVSASDEVDASKGESVTIAWKERSRRGAGTEGGGVKEKKITVFLNQVDASFSRVETGNEKDRVYLLQLNAKKNESPPERHFFWMQEPNGSNDAALARGINKLLGNETEPEKPETKTQEAGSSSANASSASAGAIQLGALSDILSSMGLPDAGAPPAAPSAPAASSSSASSLSAQDIQQVISGLAGTIRRKRSPPISEILTADDITPLLDDPEVQEVLLGLLPEARRTKEELYDVVRSPQLQRAMHVLSSALQSDNFNTMMANFNLDTKAGAEALAAGDGIGAFLQALQVDADGGKAEAADDDEDDGDWYS